MVSPARIRTNNLLAKAFNLNDFLDPTRLAHDELQYYNDLTRLFDTIISHYIDWLDSPEARKLFYEEIQNREEYFNTIDKDLDDIIQDTSLSADRIIEKVYRKGLNYGYKDINRLPVFNDACKYGLKATQEYNFELIQSVSNDLKDSIRHHIFRGVAEGQSIHEVARAITDSGLKPIEGKTLSAYQRASLIARTEIARSMTTGRLQSYANYGVEKVKILTAGDSNVCPICLEAAHIFNGEKTHDNIIGEKVYSLEDASNLIPFHPACRCSVIAHIEHYQDIPQKPIDNSEIIDLISYAPNKSNNQNFSKSAIQEFNELKDDSNIEWSLDERINFNRDGLYNHEPFIKYHFKDSGITIYKSLFNDVASVREIHDFFKGLPKELTPVCKEIVLSHQMLEKEIDGNIRYVGGFTRKGSLDRINILDQPNLSVEDIKWRIVHELVHTIDGDNYIYSNHPDFIEAFNLDKSKLDEITILEEEDRYVSEYSANFTSNALNGGKGKDRPYSEDFAECVVEYFKNYDNFAWKFPEKAKFINNLFHNYN